MADETENDTNAQEEEDDSHVADNEDDVEDNEDGVEDNEDDVEMKVINILCLYAFITYRIAKKKFC